MSPGDTGSESLGARLRAARLRKNATLSQAAEATRIKSTQLEMMEAERFDQVGAPIYVKGFLRLYGEFLGLDGEELVREYLQCHGPARPALPREAAPQVLRRRTAPSPELAPPTDLTGREADAGPVSAPGRIPLRERWLIFRAAVASPSAMRAVRRVAGVALTVVLAVLAVRSISAWTSRWAAAAPTAPTGWTDVIEPPPDPWLDPQGLRAAAPRRP